MVAAAAIAFAARWAPTHPLSGLLRATAYSFSTNPCSLRNRMNQTPPLEEAERLVWKRFHSGGIHLGEALELFQTLLESQSPETHVCNSLLSSIARSRNLGGVFALYTRMVWDGDFCPDAYTSGILISSAGAMGRVELGFGVLCDIFKSGRRPNTLVLTSLVNGLCKQNDIGGALEVFAKMPEMGCPPDVVTYNTFIGCCCNMGRLELGFSMLGDMVKRGCHADTVTLNALMNGLCKAGRIADAVAVMVGRMPETGCTASAVSYSTLICCLCSRRDEVGLGFGFLCDMLKRGYHVIQDIFSGMLSGLFKVGRIVDAAAVFHRMPVMGSSPDAVTYGTLIDHCSRLGEMELGFGFLCCMLKQGHHPNVVAFSALVNGFCKDYRIADAAFVVQRMPEISNPNDITYSIIVDCCCRLGRVDLGFGAFCVMLKRGCHPDVVILSSLLNGLTKSNAIDAAVALFNKMPCMGCLPNSVTFGIMIDSCCRLGQVDLGFGLFCSMLKQGHAANRVILNCLIYGLSMSNNVVAAATWIERMPTLKCTPDVITFTALIKGLCRMGHFEMALELHRGINQPESPCRPDLIAYNMIIESLCKEGAMDDCLELVQEMENEGIHPNAFTYTCIIHGFSNLGKWDEVIKILQMMVNAGFSPSSIHNSSLGVEATSKICEAAS